MIERKLRIESRWKKINALFFILIFSGLLFTALREIHLFFTSVEFYQDELLAYKADVVQQEIHNRIDEIDSIMITAETDFRSELKDLISAVDHFANQSVLRLDTNASMKLKREVYIDTVYQYDISEGEYLFFALDLDGIAWLLGLNTSDEGTDLSGMLDPITGEPFISDMIFKVRNSNNGSEYHTYNWPKVLDGEPKLKTSFLLYNESVDLFIGTGVYYEDYISSVQERYFNRLRTYYEDTEEYVYVYGYDGTPYIHKNPNLTKEDVLSVLDKNGDPLHPTLVKGVQSETHYSFSYDYLGVEKIGIVHNIPEWEMYIGQSYSLNEIEKLRRQYIRTSIPSFVTSVILFAILSIGLMSYIKSLMKRNFSDVHTEFQEQNDIVQKISLTDSLTGLFNRKYFSAAFNEYLQEHDEYALIVGDANGLKLTNDTFGHEEGDELLRAISRLLEEIFESDYTFRWGGDEFLVLVDITDINLLNSKIDRFNDLSKIRSTSKIQISASLGFAIGRKEENDVYDVMKAAEKLMYERKTTESSLHKRKIIDTVLNSLFTSYCFEKQHSENVKNSSVLIGEAMGLSVEDVNRLRLSALLHDVGKIAIPDNIMCSREKLSDEEYEVVKKHPEKGYQILQAYPELSEYAHIVHHHHERYDGTGYPKGLKGKKIPFFSRIITIADAYDGMVEDRLFRDAMPKEQAIEEMIRCRGTQFDPDIVDIFITLIKKFEYINT